MKIKRSLPLLLAGTLVISSFAGCKSDNGNVVAVLNGEEIQLEILNFMCKYEQAKNCDTYVGYFGEDFFQRLLIDPKQYHQHNPLCQLHHNKES